MLSTPGTNAVYDQTTPYSEVVPAFGTSALIPFSVAVTIALGLGTAGQYTAEYYKQREAKLYFNGDHHTQNGHIATTADELARIRSTLKLTVAELADCIGVSRQAIYNWKSGADIKTKNAQKIESLKSATDAIATTGLSISALHLNRKLPGGKTLLEIVSTGGDGGSAARALVRMLQEEAETRRKLDERFAGRSLPQHSDIIFGA